jgi:hypothetical protein
MKTLSLIGHCIMVLGLVIVAGAMALVFLGMALAPH